MNDFLGYTLEYFRKEAISQGYVIEDSDFLNGPPGIARVVRIKEVSPKTIHILIVYEKQLAINKKPPLYN